MSRAWFYNYEKRRLSNSNSDYNSNFKEPKEPREPQFKYDNNSELWQSTKYPIESMHHDEVKQIWLPILRMNWGQAISAMKRSWIAYRIAGRKGEPREDLAIRIRKIQGAMGISKSDFPELTEMGYTDEDDDEEEAEDWTQGLTEDEIQARMDEEREREWNQGFNSSDEESNDWFNDNNSNNNQTEVDDDW